jgi:hypothetical protein
MANVNPRFIETLKNPENRFTLILGSGFHKQALKEESILSSWEKLLKHQNKNIVLTDCYPLDFEQLIINRTQNQDFVNEQTSHKIEDLISKEICFDLKCAQQRAMNFNKEKYPSEIFNPDIISDIISLNFDSIGLELCAEKAGVDISLLEPKQFSYKGKDVKSVYYYEVKFSENRSIRFWFPHGTILGDSKITLGTRNYSLKLATVENLRKYSKSKEAQERNGNKSEIETSWYHQLIYNPVLILGAEMSTSEWDIWFALVNRERNFSKRSTVNFKHPIFQMRNCEAINKIQTSWFESLFVGLKFDEQWRELGKYFNKKRR